MPTPNDPHLGDTLGPSRAGRVDPAIGDTQGGKRSHERPSFADPITTERSDLGSAPDRVPGAASTTPETADDRPGFPAIAPDGRGIDADADSLVAREAPMRGAGTPVRREES